METATSPWVLRSPAAVFFGRGARAAAGPAVASLGRRALVCTDATLAATQPFAALLRALRAAAVEVHVLDGALPELPGPALEAIAARARASRADVVVGYGGGSCLDAAKVAALRLAHREPLAALYGENAVPGPVRPIVAIPTTAGTGSEVSPNAIVTDPDRRTKVGISSPHLIPTVALCDPELTVGCPPAVTAHAGVDALVHAVESFTARRRAQDWTAFPGGVFRGKNPVSDALALEAIRRLAPALARAVEHGDDLDAREAMLHASVLAGVALSQAGTHVAHLLQYPIGALTGTPHGLGVGLLMPYGLQWAAPAVGAELARIGDALGLEPGAGAEATIAALAELVAAVGIPRRLADLGLERDQLPAIARSGLAITRLRDNSPRPLEAEDLERILAAAWHGDRAAAAA